MRRNRVGPEGRGGAAPPLGDPSRDRTLADRFVFTASGPKAFDCGMSESRAARLAGVLHIELDAAARLVPQRRRPFHSRSPKKCAVCSGAFIPTAPHQLTCNGCRARALLQEASA